ncbi:E3 ubiquitin-protein ligase NEDD4-like isoform X2 [Arapaima gigas]
MARRLRLHFAAQRSNTDPLSDTCTRGGEGASIQVKVTPGQLALFQSRHSSLFIPRVGGPCNKRSTLQISLQPSKLNGDVEDCRGAHCMEDCGQGDTEELAPSSDGSSSSGSSTASDAGYCSSGSVFDAYSSEQVPRPEGAQVWVRTPLRRCSSLVIFPRSPGNTPPASPIGCYLSSHQLLLSTEEPALDCRPAASKAPVATCISGLHLSKGTYTVLEPQDPRLVAPAVTLPELLDKAEGGRADDKGLVQQSGILLHFTQLPPKKGAAWSSSCPTDQVSPHSKLLRSTSVCAVRPAAAQEWPEETAAP